MPFTAKTSIIPPTPGHSKMLWSPELFDVNTGAYPISPLPATCTYPMLNNQIQFFEGYYGDRTWPIAFAAATNLTDPEKLYDEQNAVIIDGNEAASLFTFANYTAESLAVDADPPTDPASESNSYQLTYKSFTFYTGEITFASGMIIDPHYCLVFDATLTVESVTVDEQPGGIQTGTYSPVCSLDVEISLDAGLTWKHFIRLCLAGAHAPGEHFSNVSIIPKGTNHKIITGAVNLLKLQFRIVANTEVMSTWFPRDGIGPQWSNGGNYASNITTNLFALFLEGVRYPLNPLTITTGGDLLRIAATTTHESDLWALGKLTYGCAAERESDSGSQNGYGQDAWDITYPCSATPSSKLVIDSTIYDVESFEWDEEVYTEVTTGGPTWNIHYTKTTAMILTLVGHPNLAGILSLGKEVYWI
jgi:hypothetical protein